MSLRPIPARVVSLALLLAAAPALSAQEMVDVSSLPMVVGHGTVGFVVYKGPAIPNVFWRCFDGVSFSSIGEIAEEVHLLQAGDLSSFTIAYHVEGAVGASGTCTANVKFYANDPADGLTPATAPLLASYSVPGLPWATATNHTFTFDTPAPIAIPKDLWVAVEIAAPPGAYGSMLGASPDLLPSQNPAPTTGSSHNKTWFGPASCTPPPGELVDNFAAFGVTLNYTLAVREHLSLNCTDPIANGDFETGLITPWTGAGRYGVALAETAGVVPPSGGWQGFADTGNALPTSSALAPASRLLLELVTGVPLAALDGLNAGGTVAHGSVLSQELTVAAGETLSFKWNFLTNEGPGGNNDSAFFSVSSGGGHEEVSLAEVQSSVFSTSTSLLYARETGYHSFAHTFLSAGTFTVCIGAVDRFSTAIDSALLVDCVELTPAGPVNTPPSCSADLSLAQADFLESAPGQFVVTEGTQLVVPFTGTDPDGDLLMAALTGAPFGALLAPGSGASPLESTLTWNATAADKPDAPYTIQVTFSDPSGASSTCEVTVSDVNLNPVCSASDQTVPCSDPMGALVTLDGSASDADDPEANLLYHWFVSDLSVVLDDPDSPTPSGVFPVGITMATLTVCDQRGGVDVCDVLITVQDVLPPEVLCTSDVAALWPPKHAMIPVTLVVTATDACSDPSLVLPITVRVSCNEPDDAPDGGDGSTSGDVNGSDGYASPVDVTPAFSYDPLTGQWTGTVQLRAERGGSGSGRKYTIDVQALDTSGNAAVTSCCIVVPHDRRPGS